MGKSSYHLPVVAGEDRKVLEKQSLQGENCQNG